MPYSNYSKIRDMLRELERADGPQGMEQLAESIRSRGIESFSIWRPAAGPGSSARTYCSVDAIRRLIRLASELGFVDTEDGDRCSLTRRGSTALLEGNYDKTLSTQLALFLKEKVGVTYTDIKDAITSIQRPEVPSFQTVYDRLSSKRSLGVAEDEFRSLLYLMERCGMLETKIRKLYFAPGVQL